MITSVEEMISQYMNAWNGTGIEEYQREFAKCWAVDGAYTDPNFDNINGVDGIAGLAHKSLETFPVRTFSELTVPDYHHNVGRYTWKVELPGETREGFDYFEFNESYQITRIVSFFGPLTNIG
ncbi:hypothetical protein ACFP1I_02005 [Dyadobacter subterraneus]|uniref:Isomerase n=1 Tax=Dyadobacter subterraneus TaxID=2773304 RepID=A0ABR9W7T7_9BACT|nr:isomerase [Dyadobacter subterraneus]MBE9461525.1 isomerase [Dyadobacter subterraneus]